ncbi:MAG: hypothetical protein MUP63_02640, partial [Candidatus Nanohaloarchaeota archaeon QJJ-7]|nr:hypothetical protein [Candidatus Nanohaloarchaeota archaeon QJJ-7]
MGWITDVDGDGVSNGEELIEGDNPLGEPTVREESSIRERAMEHAEHKYPDQSYRVAEFIEDDRVDDRFIDEQLKIWLSAPDSVERGRHTILDYPAQILKHGLLYANDWNMNGEPHLMPEGRPGPDYDNPFELNPDKDAFMPRFYNHSKQVHDITTGEYLGFQPEEGDKVGKMGDRDGNGSIAEYLDGNVEPEDLTGSRITVTWTDTAEDPEKVDGSFDILEDFFREKPPDDHSIDFYGINGVKRDGVEITSLKPDAHQMIEYYESNVPEELKGPVNYMILIRHFDGLPVALATSPSPGGMGFSDNPTFNIAYLTLHELYWHGLTGKPHPGERPEDTLASYPPSPESPDELDFLDKEWERVMN